MADTTPLLPVVVGGLLTLGGTVAVGIGSFILPKFNNAVSTRNVVPKSSRKWSQRFTFR